jgi:hypothetical protein
MALAFAGFILIALIDLVPLIRQREGRGVLAFLLLFIPSLVIAYLLAKNITVPSAMLWLGEVFKALGLSY